MNSRQIFISIFLLLFIISGVFLLLKRQDLADEVASISLIFFLMGFLYSPIKSVFCYFNRLIKRVYNLPFRWVLGIICLFYLFSSFVQFGQDEGWYLTVPKVYGADEEHLLLMMNSLIRDYDLELSNNYENARSGGYDAGEIWRYKYLDHHSIFVHKETKEKVHFWKVVDVGGDFSKWEIKNPSVWENRDRYCERPHHPPGMSFVFAFFLLPFRWMRDIESIALILNTFFILISFVILHKMLISLDIKEGYACMSIFLIVLATPLYHYSLILMKEAFLGVILILVCWLYFFKKRPFLSGIFVIIGCAVRYALPVVVIPMFLWGIIKREWRLVINFLISIIFGSTIYMLYNYHIYGGPFSTGREAEFGGLLNVHTISIIFIIIPSIIIAGYLLLRVIKIHHFIRNNARLVRPVVFIICILILTVLCIKNTKLRAVLIDLDDGILPVAPFLIIAIFKLLDINMWRDNRVAGIFGMAFAYACIYIVAGGVEELSVYSARKVIPILFFFTIPLSFWLMDNKNRFFNRIFLILVGYSVLINFLASLARRYFWHLPLDQALVQLFKRWLWL